eukprot:GDKJ01019942.1.p1 GENE.GDKJ01019942.1~~GDKJ01019942.1.p1  ORF type:complete len:534 (+),score=104.41 GDKJ01019942.1:106-1707(+)
MFRRICSSSRMCRSVLSNRYFTSKKNPYDYSDLGVYSDRIEIRTPNVSQPIKLSLASLEDSVRFYCGKQVIPQSMEYVAFTDDLETYANILRRELPTRFAQRIVLVNGLFARYGSHSPAVAIGLERSNAILLRAYGELVIEALLAKTISSPADRIDQLRKVLAQQATRGCNSIPPLLSALHSLRSFSADGRPPPSGADAALIDNLFETYAISRISTSALSDHFAAVCQEVLPGEKRATGVFTASMDVIETLRRAVLDALEVCEFHLGKDIPNVEIWSKGFVPPVTGLPAHVHYAVFEVVKNAVRATVKLREGGGICEKWVDDKSASSTSLEKKELVKSRSHQQLSEDDSKEGRKRKRGTGCENVRVLVSLLADEGDHEIVFKDWTDWTRRKGDAKRISIKVCDKGAGLSQARLENVFKVFVTTNMASKSAISDRLQESNTTAGTANPTEVPTSPGAGVGLSMARLYVRYLAGDVKLASEGLGKGTTSIIEFPIKGENWVEGMEGSEEVIRSLVALQQGITPIDTTIVEKKKHI